MRKVLICNISLLIGQSKPEERECVLSMINDFIIDMGYIVIFVSHDKNILETAKKYFSDSNFIFALRGRVKNFVEKNYNMRHAFVVIGNKDVDFYLAVNNKLLLIVPEWLAPEEKISRYGVHVDNPSQLYTFIKILYNNSGWYSCVSIDEKTDCISLYDARTRLPLLSDGRREILSAFQSILKQGQSRNYYQILLYYFLANMTRDETFDDITIFGVMPSSDGSISPDLFSFVEQIRVINNLKYPNSIKDCETRDKNILLRHIAKRKRHVGDQNERLRLGGTDEFNSLIINPLYKERIEDLKRKKALNICILDDYVNYGNGFNAVRCLLEEIGANKIKLVSLGMFRTQFYKKNYSIIGNVYSPGYSYKLIDEQTLRDFVINETAQADIDYIYNVFNSTQHEG